MTTVRVPASRLALILPWVLATGPAVAQEVGRVQTICLQCHVEAGFDKGTALAHAHPVSCLSCHHLGFTNDPELAAQRRLEACVECHAEADVRHVPVDPHGAEPGALPSCMRCHSVHLPEGTDRTAAVDGECRSCHTDDHVLHEAVQDDAPGCASCHVEHERTGAGRRISGAEQCRTCHEDSHPSHVLEDGRDLDCMVCHEEGEGVPVTDDPLRLNETCVRCHEGVAPAHEHVEDGPGCAGCHDFAKDLTLDRAGPEMSGRCGDCHEEALLHFELGGHRDGLTSEEAGELPTCLSCHASHADPGTDRSRLRLEATARCVECHSTETLIEKYGLPSNAAPSYLDDYHGVTVEFLRIGGVSDADPVVMICSDCHGPHEVGWDEGASIADVCLECHEGADALIEGAWLGHARVGPRSQLAIWAVRAFYYVMIPFVLVGLASNIAFNLVDQRRKGARMLRTEGVRKLVARLRRRASPTEERVTRFTKIERLEHLGALITFPLLVLTGLPQTSPGSAFGRAVIDLFGGITSTRLVHRVTGFLFVALLLAHLARGVARIARSRRLPEIAPRVGDFKDTVAMVRHFLWGAPRPKVGKFDASEKFEYWGLFFGGIIMSVTGLALIFPEFVTQWLPGVVVAAMRTMHGLEATFAVLVVVLWHSYGVLLRPEIFPLDTTMFTGKISLHRLREEHALQYEELFESAEASD